MADPLSLAASAAGLLSLGIQVTQGINAYLDALKCRSEELDAVKQKNDALRRTIDFVKSAVSSPQPLNQSHAAVADSIASCEGELSGLEDLVAKLAGCKSTKTWKARLKNQSRKWSYAFDRSKIQQLSQRLDQANGTLQISLQGLGLQIAQRSEQTLDGVATDIRGFSAEFRSIRSEVASLDQRLEENYTLQHGHYSRVEDHFVKHTASLSTIISTAQNQNTALITQNSELVAEIGNLRKIIITSQERLSPSQTQTRVTPAQAVVRVARSPPSHLQKICDNFGGRDSIEIASNEFDDLTCLCTGARAKEVRGSARWGSLFLYHERSRKAHQPHCPLAKNTAKAGLSFLTVTKVLRVAIDMSFTLSSGAGGWSLSPNFTYRPTVDRMKDPAFRVLWDLTSRYGKDNSQDKVERALQKLKQIYTERRSAPNAVDSRNNTLLHWLFFETSSWMFKNIDWEKLYKGLRSFGVPATSHNLEGDTCATCFVALIDKKNPESVSAVSRILERDFAGINIGRCIDIYDLKSPHELIHTQSLSRTIAEAYQCGPMSLAVLANNAEEVVRLLDNCPDSMLEQNLLGQTPLHLAADKLSCLVPLVRAATPSLLNQRDFVGDTALRYAMDLSGQLCINSHKRQRCSECHCAQFTTVLLKADCAVHFDHQIYDDFFNRASERARRQFVSHLKDRRQRLRQLAQMNPLVISKGGLSFRGDEIPDAKAPLIVNLLRANNIVIPPALDTFTTEDTYHSIFHMLYNAEDAELFFQMGFTDIDSVVDGQTPLTFLSSAHRVDFTYLEWLVEHGADICRLLLPSQLLLDSSEPRGIFAAHAVFYKVGQSYPKYLGSPRAMNTLMTPVLASNLRDGCNCTCSDGGCTPLRYLLKAIQPRFGWPGLPEDDAEVVVQYFEILDKALDVQLQLSSIRWITFKALGFTHTCCDPEEVLDFGSSSAALETDDLALLGEDPEVLRLFEELVEELQQTAQNAHITTSSLVDFWINIWAPRVKEEKKKLSGNELSEEERRNAEALGVTWHPDSPPEAQAASTVAGNPYRWGTWESVEWKDRQRRLYWQYYRRNPIKPRASAFLSYQEAESNDSWSTVDDTSSEGIRSTEE